MRPRKRVDSFFLWIVIGLVSIGTFIFISAWFGLLVREEVRYSSVFFMHTVSIVLGFAALFIASKVPYQFWKKSSFYIFVGSIVLTLLVFIPGLGVTHGGATRWLDIGVTSIQPAEFLKIGFLLYFAALLSSLKGDINSLRDGVLPIFGIFAIIGVILVKQPDTGTFMVIFASGLAMFIAAGGKWKYIMAFVMSGITTITALAYARPYIMERFLTFFDPARDSLDAGWQIKQSLIAIGSGGVFGRGFGQSIQKFGYLPEPIGDSIFAVAAEEFGFIGAATIIVLFLLLAFRGLQIAKKTPNQFSGLLVTGIVILIIAQSFINIGAMLGVLPLTGMPLLFISHGGTAFILVMFAMGIILNISKYTKS
ncbi:MAG: cell division protein FtsW [Candidatus Pacebacteria bacterium]|nr:cell division protein FtsW [Candidatus Paceibacterota bacterium]